MTQSQELRNQEAQRHEEEVDRNIEHQQNMNLHERKRGIVAANQNSSVARVVNIIYFLFGALELMLLLRITLQFIGVNPSNPFATFVYALTYPFVALFQTLLQNPSLGGTSVLEITTMIAMLVWAIVAWMIGRFVWLVLSRPR